MTTNKIWCGYSCTQLDADIPARNFGAAYLNNFSFELDTDHMPQYVLVYGDQYKIVYYAELLICKQLVVWQKLTSYKDQGRLDTRVPVDGTGTGRAWTTLPVVEHFSRPTRF